MLKFILAPTQHVLMQLRGWIDREVHQKTFFTYVDSVERPDPGFSCYTGALNWRPPKQELDSLTKELRSLKLVFDGSRLLYREGSVQYPGCGHWILLSMVDM